MIPEQIAHTLTKHLSYLPTPYASYEHVNTRRIPLGIAITMPNLQLNCDRCIRFLIFDIDDDLGSLAWEAPGAPIPNLICTNPRNGHAHLIYILEKPLSLRGGPSPVIRYYKAVKNALGSLLGADKNYAGLTTKNPFSPSWVTTSARTAPYTLGELAEHLDLNTVYDKEAMFIENGLGRNCTLFDSIRMWAYRSKRHFNNFTDFQDCLFEELDRLNSNLLRHVKGSLADRELYGIGKSVSEWVWNIYTGDGKDTRRRGIMCLSKTLPLSERQRLGQAGSVKFKMENNLSRVRAAIRTLTSRGIRTTKTAIAKLAGFNHKTVSAYWDQCSDLLTQSVDPVTIKNFSIITESVSFTQQPNSLIPTQTDISFDDYKRAQNDPKTAYIRAAAKALKLAQEGVMMTGMPKTLESMVLRHIDNWRTQRHTYDQQIT